MIRDAIDGNYYTYDKTGCLSSAWVYDYYPKMTEEDEEIDVQIRPFRIDQGIHIRGVLTPCGWFAVFLDEALPTTPLGQWLLAQIVNVMRKWKTKEVYLRIMA